MCYWVEKNTCLLFLCHIHLKGTTRVPIHLFSRYNWIIYKYFLISKSHFPSISQHSGINESNCGKRIVWIEKWIMFQNSARLWFTQNKSFAWKPNISYLKLSTLKMTFIFQEASDFLMQIDLWWVGSIIFPNLFSHVWTTVVAQLRVHS